MKISRLLPVAAVFAFALAAKANVVVNGDFDPTHYTFPGYSQPPYGNTTVTGWTLSNAGVGGTPYDTAGFYNYDFQPAHMTAGFIQGVGSLSQSLSLISGHTYSYSFLYDARRSYAPTTFNASVGITSLVNNAVLAPGGGFITANGTFVGTGTENLVFTGNAGGLDGTAVVTGVNIVDITRTPEPSSLALLGTGVLGVAGFARRKFVKA